MFCFGFLNISFYCTCLSGLRFVNFSRYSYCFEFHSIDVCVCVFVFVCLCVFVYLRLLCALIVVVVFGARQLKSKLDEHLHIKEISQIRLGSSWGLLRGAAATAYSFISIKWNFTFVLLLFLSFSVRRRHLNSTTASVCNGRESSTPATSYTQRE